MLDILQILNDFIEVNSHFLRMYCIGREVVPEVSDLNNGITFTFDFFDMPTL